MDLRRICLSLFQGLTDRVNVKHFVTLPESQCGQGGILCCATCCMFCFSLVGCTSLNSGFCPILNPRFCPILNPGFYPHETQKGTLDFGEYLNFLVRFSPICISEFLCIILHFYAYFGSFQQISREWLV